MAADTCIRRHAGPVPPPGPRRHRPGATARRLAAAAAATAGLAATLVVGGCGRTMVDDLAPWGPEFDPPTSMTERGPGPDTVLDERAIVVGHFEEPEFASVQWTGIGADMADALARTLLNRSRLNVIVNPRLAADVARLREQPDDARLAALEAIQRAHPNVRLVVNGRITDFLHTDDIDRRLHRRTITFGRSREAIVGLQLDVFDLQLGRTVATDHLVGTADAPKRDVEKLYRNLGFDSAVYWATPLGQASSRTILAAVEVMDRMVPVAGPEIVIAAHDGREIELYVASGRPLRRNQRLFVYERLDDGSLRAVRDPVSGQQLRAHVMKDGRSRVEAILFGLPADGIDLRGTELLPVSAREGGETAGGPRDGEGGPVATAGSRG